MLRSRVFALTALVLTPLAAAQQPSLVGSEVTLAEGAEQMRKWHAHLRGEVERAARELTKAEDAHGALNEKCAALRRAALGQLQKAHEIESDYQLLLDLRDRAGKPAAGKRTLAAWLDAARAAGKETQAHDYSKVDEHARSAPADASSTVARLSAYLLKAAKTDREKARAAAVWMAAHVAYSPDAAPKAAAPPKVAEIVLQQKRGDGVSLASLYDALARACGLKSQIVPGDVRVVEDGRDFARATHASPLGFSYADHAWNAVVIEGRWQLVDPSFICPPAGRKQKEGGPDLTYFLMPPRQFLRTHVPHLDRWQLVDSPVKLKDHLGLTTLRPAFFRHGLGLGLHEAGQVKVADAFVCSLRVPEGKSLLVQVHPKAAKDENAKVAALVQTDAKSGFEDVCVAFPKAGTYFVRVFAAKRGTVGTAWDWALEYQVEARSAAKGGELPKSFSDFQDRRCYLHGPFTGTLKAGASQVFKLSVPDAFRVFIRNGDKQFSLQDRDGVFEGEVELQAGEVTVNAVFPGELTTFKRLLRYEAK